MSVGSPLVFRPSFAQRAMAMLLFAGSWLVGVRALAQVLEHLPALRMGLEVAQLTGEATWSFYVAMVASVAAMIAGGLLLLGTLFGLLLVEGSHILVDDLGIAVDHSALPPFLARRLGAGRLPWKRISRISRRGFFFVLEGGGEPSQVLEPKDPTLRFLLVDHLERLVLLIMERSPNLKHD
ncbi:MAG TPA: hypothetical protein VF768_05580 [Holophagaceae bacterium]